MTLRSVTYLKAVFETGDIPTGTDYSDIFDSFVSLHSSAAQTMQGELITPNVSTSTLSVTGYAKLSYVSANATGTSQGAATDVSANTSYVYVAGSANRSIKLSTFVLGGIHFITNASNSVTAAYIYPASGVSFMGTAANAPVLLAASRTMLAKPVDASVLAFARF